MRRNLDEYVEKAIMASAKKNNVSYAVARAVVMHNFNWLRSSISKAEYANYLLPRLGTFKYFIRKSRVEKTENDIDYLEYHISTSIKDNRMILDGDLDGVDENKQKLVDEISKLNPLIKDHKKLLKEYRKSYWSSLDEYGWNIKYMLLKLSEDDLINLKNIIENAS